MGILPTSLTLNTSRNSEAYWMTSPSCFFILHILKMFSKERKVVQWQLCYFISLIYFQVIMNNSHTKNTYPRVQCCYSKVSVLKIVIVHESVDLLSGKCAWMMLHQCHPTGLLENKLHFNTMGLTFKWTHIGWLCKSQWSNRLKLIMTSVIYWTV